MRILLPSLLPAAVQFGKIKYIDIKTPSRPPAYAFVEFGTS